MSKILHKRSLVVAVWVLEGQAEDSTVNSKRSGIALLVRLPTRTGEGSVTMLSVDWQVDII